MIATEFLIYLAHLAFWASFGVTRWVTTAPKVPLVPSAMDAAGAQREEVAPWSRSVLALHLLAFAVMYFGVGAAVIPGHVPVWFFGQGIAGACIIGIGALLACWGVASFQSWRFRAKLEQGHRLATRGAFRFLRHPIYMGLNLLALGTAIWIPTAIVWLGAVLMVVGSELRARTEERVLATAFGAAYEAYRSRTRRFIPGIY